MKRGAWIALLALFTTCGALGQGLPGDDVDLRVHSVRRSTDMFIDVLFEATNRSATPARYIRVHCTAFAADKTPLATGDALVPNVRPSETAYETAMVNVPRGGKEAGSAVCRVTDVTR
jgi:hypothetical protein